VTYDISMFEIALSNVRVFYPNREDFDFTRVVEFSTSPFHFVFGRSDDITAVSLFRDIVHAQLQPDLNAYREDAFEPPLLTSEEGRIALTWGYTFMLQEGDRSFQGIYVGPVRTSPPRRMRISMLSSRRC
jgi:hypothetical protein